MPTKKWCEDNPDKMKKSRRDWYERNRGSEIKKAAERRARDIQRNIEYVRELKVGIPCLDCGISYIPEVMEFDHVKGKKFKPISEMVRASVSIRRLQEEIDKCELVCANCHRIRTVNRRSDAKEASLSPKQTEVGSIPTWPAKA